MPRTPPIMSALQERNLPLQPRRERLHRAGSFCAGDWRRMPAWVRLRTGIVFRKILDDHRPAVALEQLQGREDDPLLERGIARRAEWPPQLERHPQGARRPGILGLRPDQADRDG